MRFKISDLISTYFIKLIHIIRIITHDSYKASIIC